MNMERGEKKNGKEWKVKNEGRERWFLCSSGRSPKLLQTWVRRKSERERESLKLTELDRDSVSQLFLSNMRIILSLSRFSFAYSSLNNVHHKRKEKGEGERKWL